mmetsp:Transcript_30427/g.80911  ORF Transcript_30427/g.80911 Transcript_30427/m.80911 type:complete len:305 (+) Transcript_30427:946-1860(+)
MWPLPSVSKRRKASSTSCSSSSVVVGSRMDRARCDVSWLDKYSSRLSRWRTRRSQTRRAISDQKKTDLVLRVRYFFKPTVSSAAGIPCLANPQKFSELHSSVSKRAFLCRARWMRHRIGKNSNLALMSSISLALTNVTAQCVCATKSTLTPYLPAQLESPSTDVSPKLSPGLRTTRVVDRLCFLSASASAESNGSSKRTCPEWTTMSPLAFSFQSKMMDLSEKYMVSLLISISAENKHRMFLIDSSSDKNKTLENTLFSTRWATATRRFSGNPSRDRISLCWGSAKGRRRDICRVAWSIPETIR